MTVYDKDKMRPLARRRSTSTSVAAAIDATAKAPNMTEEIWPMFADGPLSPEDIHARLTANGERVLLTSVRARVCGLRRAGRLVDSGERGLGESQKSKVVRWRRSTPSEMSDYLAKTAAEAEG